MGFFSNLFEPKKKEPAITGRTENINTLFGFVEDSPSIAPRRRQAAPEADVGPGSFLQETFTATAGPRTREQSQRNIRRNLLKDTFKPKDLPDLPVERPIDKTQDDLEAAALTANMFAPKDKDVFKRIGSAFTGATHSTVARPVKGITAGFLDASESILAFSQWSKKKTGGLVGLGIPGIGGSKLTDITVSTVKDKANAWKEAIEPEDSDFLDALAGGAGSSLLFFIPGLGISKWAQVVGKVSPKIAMFFGQSTSAFLESAVESGSVLEEAKALGANEKEADIAATRSFTANMLVNFLGNRFGILGGEGKTVLRTALRNMTSEGLQEFVQQIINNDSLNSTGKVQLELDDGAYEAGAIGAILGPILGSAGGGTVRPPSGTTKPKGKAPEVAAKETPATRLQRSVNEGKDFAQLELQQMAKEGIISENRLAFLTPSENIRGGIEDIKRGKAKDASIKLTDNEMRTHLQQFKPVYRDAIEQTFSRGGKNNLTDRILELRSQLNELSPNKLEFKRVEKEFLRLSEVRTRFEDARAAKSITFNPLPKDSVPSKEVIGEQRKAGLRGEEKPKKPTPKEAEAISRVKEVFTPTEDLTLSPADKTAAKKKGGVLNNIITKFAKRMASEQKGQFILDELSNKGVSPQELNDKFWKNTYDSVSPDIQKKIQGMLKSEIGFEPGDVMGVDKKGGKIIAQNWKDVGLVMDVGDNAALLEGTERGYVSIIAEASARFSKDVVEKKPVVQPKSKEEILKLVTPTEDLTLSPADKTAAKKFEETLPKEVKEKLDATRKSRQRPQQLKTIADLTDLVKDMRRAGAPSDQIQKIQGEIKDIKARLESPTVKTRRETREQRERAEVAEKKVARLEREQRRQPQQPRRRKGRRGALATPSSVLRTELSLSPEVVRQGPTFDDIVQQSPVPASKKVNILDYIKTPNRVFEKIGLKNEVDFAKGQWRKFRVELPKQIDKITAWTKRVPGKESNRKIFQKLDGDTAIELTTEEDAVAGEIREYLNELASRLGLAPNERVSNYITRIWDRGAEGMDFDQDIAKLIDEKIPGSIYNPFLLQRKGEIGYKKDTWAALDAYTKRAIRKINMDPALERIKNVSDQLELSQFKFVQGKLARLNLRPTEVDTLIDNFIISVVGFRAGPRPTASILRGARRVIYRGTLGLNISSVMKNMTQQVNNYAKLGEKYLAVGHIQLMKKSFSGEAQKELYATGILNDNIIQDRTLSAARKFWEKFDRVLFSMWDTVEVYNRGVSYYGRKQQVMDQEVKKLKKKGKEPTDKQFKQIEAFAIKEAIRTVEDTQFVFGPLDTPGVLDSDILKTALQFQSFSIKQAEFLGEHIKARDFIFMTRYMLGTIALAGSVGKLIGMDWDEFLPFVGFEKGAPKLEVRFNPPTIQFPTALLSTMFNVPDKFGNVREGETLERILNDAVLRRSVTMLIPGGTQIRKSIEGIQVIEAGDVRSASGKTKKFDVKDTMGNRIRAYIFGKWGTDEGRKYIRENYGPGIPFKGLFVPKKAKKATRKKRKTN